MSGGLGIPLLDFSDLRQSIGGLSQLGLRAEAQKLYGQQLDGLMQAQGQTPLGALGASAPAAQPQRLGALGQPVAMPAFASNDGDIGSYLASTRARESGGNDLAANPNSTAKGRYQFTDDTWRNVAKAHPELGLQPGGWRDPGQQERAMQAFTADNAKLLTSAGIPINPANLYGAHFLGAGGARQFIPNAINNPDAPAVQFVSPGAARANRAVFFNRDGSPKTAGEVYAWMGGPRGSGAPAAPAPRTQVASADSADMPAEGAVPVRFQPPAGQSDAFEPGTVASPAIATGSGGAVPAATAGAPRITPERAQLLRQMLANPLTAPQAAAEIQRLSAPPKYELKELNGRVVRIDDRGNAVPVPGFDKPAEYQTQKGSDGNDYTFNKATGQWTRAIQGKPTEFRSLVTPEERAAAGIPTTYSGPAQLGPDGELKLPGKASTEVNIDNKGESAFATTANKGIAERFLAISQEGDAGRTDLAFLGQLKALGSDISTGLGAQATKVLGDYGIDIGPNTGKVQAYSSLIDKLTPSQRIPGAGATSDFDAKLFKSSLPRLINTPEGNALITGTLEAVAQDKVARAAIAEKALTGEMKPNEVIRELRNLPSPNLVLRSGLSELQKGGKLGAGTAPAAGSPAERLSSSSGTGRKMPDAVAEQARAALEEGRSRQGVIDKLKRLGFDPSGL